MKGKYKRTKEIKEKIKNSLLKYNKTHVISSETIKKLKEKRKGKKPMLGKKHSLKTIKLFKKQRKLWWKDPEFRKKSLENRIIGINVFGKGELNPMWRGGIKDIKLQIRFSDKYKEWRKKIYLRDKFTCQNCGYRHKNGKKRKILDADHIIPFSFLLQQLIKEKGKENLFNNALNFKDLWDINNGRTLCRDCHKKTDTFLNRWHQKYVN